MFTLLYKWLLSIFTADKIGILVRSVLLQAGKAYTKEILDPLNQKVAYDFVKALKQRDDLTNLQKAHEFNKNMLEWMKQVNKKIAISSINCLRELAVNAIKNET